MVAQGMGVASRACLRTANRETHGSYASCACTGRLGGAERGGYQPNEETMAASPLSPSLVCLFILKSRLNANALVRCKRHKFVDRRHKGGQIFARTRCERHLKASTQRTARPAVETTTTVPGGKARFPSSKPQGHATKTRWSSSTQSVADAFRPLWLCEPHAGSSNCTQYCRLCTVVVV